MRRFLIREDVAGATFMAFGSAAPEIIVNAVSTIKQAKAKAGDEERYRCYKYWNRSHSWKWNDSFSCDSWRLRVQHRRRYSTSSETTPLVARRWGLCYSPIASLHFFHDGKIVLYESLTLVGFYIVYVMTVIFAPKIRREYRHRILKKPKKKRKTFVNKTSNNEPLLTAQASNGDRASRNVQDADNNGEEEPFRRDNSR